MCEQTVKIVSFLEDYFNEPVEIINPYLGRAGETEITAKLKSLPRHIFRYSQRTKSWIGNSFWNNQKIYDIKVND